MTDTILLSVYQSHLSKVAELNAQAAQIAHAREIEDARLAGVLEGVQLAQQYASQTKHVEHPAEPVRKSTVAQGRGEPVRVVVIRPVATPGVEAEVESEYEYEPPANDTPRPIPPWATRPEPEPDNNLDDSDDDYDDPSEDEYRDAEPESDAEPVEVRRREYDYGYGKHVVNHAVLNPSGLLTYNGKSVQLKSTTASGVQLLLASEAGSVSRDEYFRRVLAAEPSDAGIEDRRNKHLYRARKEINPVGLYLSSGQDRVYFCRR